MKYLVDQHIEGDGRYPHVHLYPRYAPHCKSAIIRDLIVAGYLTQVAYFNQESIELIGVLGEDTLTLSGADWIIGLRR